MLRYGLMDQCSLSRATGTNTIDAIAGYDPYNQSTAFFADVSGIPHIIVLGGADAVAGTPQTGVYICTQ
jgi:hypothetical protein